MAARYQVGGVAASPRRGIECDARLDRVEHLPHRGLLDLDEGVPVVVGRRPGRIARHRVDRYDHRGLIEGGSLGVGDDARGLPEARGLEGWVEGTFDGRAEEGDPFETDEIGTHPHGSHRPGR